MRHIVKVFMGIMFPLLSWTAYSPIELGYYEEPESFFEVLSLKCDTQMLGYIIANLERTGCKILSISCNESVGQIWVINYREPD